MIIKIPIKARKAAIICWYPGIKPIKMTCNKVVKKLPEYIMANAGPIYPLTQAFWPTIQHNMPKQLLIKVIAIFLAVKAAEPLKK